MDIKFEGYKLASVWSEYQDRLVQGQVVYITNSLEVNQHNSESPEMESWEFAPKTLGEFLTKALGILSPKIFEVRDLQEVLTDAKTRIALRNRQIRDLRRQLRKQS